MIFRNNKYLSIFCTVIILGVSVYLAYLSYDTASSGRFSSFGVSCQSGRYGHFCVSDFGTKLAIIFVVAGLAINYIWAKYSGY